MSVNHRAGRIDFPRCIGPQNILGLITATTIDEMVDERWTNVSIYYRYSLPDRVVKKSTPLASDTDCNWSLMCWLSLLQAMRLKQYYRSSAAPPQKQLRHLFYGFSEMHPTPKCSCINDLCLAVVHPSLACFICPPRPNQRLCHHSMFWIISYDTYRCTFCFFFELVVRLWTEHTRTQSATVRVQHPPRVSSALISNDDRSHHAKLYCRLLGVSSRYTK